MLVPVCTERPGYSFRVGMPSGWHSRWAQRHFHFVSRETDRNPQCCDMAVWNVTMQCTHPLMYSCTAIQSTHTPVLQGRVLGTLCLARPSADVWRGKALNASPSVSASKPCTGPSLPDSSMVPLPLSISPPSTCPLCPGTDTFVLENLTPHHGRYKHKHLNTNTPARH